VCPYAHCLVSIPCVHVTVYPCAHGHVSILLCIHVQAAVFTRAELGYTYAIYLCARDYVSKCMWTCIQVHVAMYSHSCGHVSTSMWPYIHEVMYSYTSFCVSTYRIWLCAMCTSRVTMCTWLCIHVYMAVDPRACGHVSTCTWPCIHMHVVMYSHGHEPMCTWPCIHI
jgi:hypothetical protein